MNIVASTALLECWIHGMNSCTSHSYKVEYFVSLGYAHCTLLHFHCIWNNTQYKVEYFECIVFERHSSIIWPMHSCVLMRGDQGYVADFCEGDKDLCDTLQGSFFSPSLLHCYTISYNEFSLLWFLFHQLKVKNWGFTTHKESFW